MTVRVALVGLGRMGRTHLEAIGRTGRVNLVAAADPSREAREVASALDVPVFETLEDLLESGGCDAAIVAAPTGSHLEVLRLLTRARIPTLCEKPAGRTPDEVREAGELARRAGVVLQIGYWKRFVPALESLRERIRSGELGEISLVACFQWDERPPSAAFRARSGGPIVDMAVHELDLMRWLTGQEIVRAAGVASTVRSEPLVVDDPESVAIVAELSGGAIGTISAGRRHSVGDTHRVQVIGTAGSEDLPFVWPPTEQEDFLQAIVRQEESFADAVEGSPVAGAMAADAEAALEAAAIASSGMLDPHPPRQGACV
jgi:myo-inositol 2-dehydrogenase/D-chiro-inositol 1-dehydrogenase